MRFKGLSKSITTNGKRRVLKVELDASASLDMLEAFIDQLCEFTIDVANPNDGVTEVYIDETTGEVIG